MSSSFSEGIPRGATHAGGKLLLLDIEKCGVELPESGRKVLDGIGAQEEGPLKPAHYRN